MKVNTAVKIFMSLVFAVVVMYGSGFVSKKVVHSEELTENIYKIEVASKEEKTVENVATAVQVEEPAPAVIEIAAADDILADKMGSAGEAAAAAAEGAVDAVDAGKNAVTEAVEGAADEAKAEVAAAVEEAAGDEVAALAGDPEKGKKFAKACVACHSFDKGGRNGVGPNLWGVAGNKKQSNPTFKYSGALIKHGGDTWTDEELDKYLKKPMKYAPGTRMSYAGIKKDEDRANVIAWLHTLSD